MKDRINKIMTDIAGKINKILIAFSVSFTLVIILYVTISEIGIFRPIDNEMVFQLFCCCLAIMAVHLLMNLIDIKIFILGVLCKFFAVIAVVLFMGIVVYKWFPMDFTFFVYLAVMLAVAFWGTLFIVYLDEMKEAHEINQMIRKSRENRKDKE